MATSILQISGMHCASCKALIEDLSTEIPGISSCVVDVEAGTATVAHDETADLKRFADEIKSIEGYDATL